MTSRPSWRSSDANEWRRSYGRAYARTERIVASRGWAALRIASTVAGVVSFGALSGQPTALDVRQDLIYRNLSHHGFWTFNWLTRASRGDIDAAYQEIVPLVTSGELTADIDSTFHLEQYADALSRAEHYQRRGKVLFVFGD